MQDIRTYAGAHATCETRNSFKSAESAIKENTKKKASSYKLGKP